MQLRFSYFRFYISLIPIFIVVTIMAAASPSIVAKIYLALVASTSIVLTMLRVVDNWKMDKFSFYFLLLSLSCTVIYMSVVYIASSDSGQILRSFEYWSIGFKLISGPLIMLLSVRLKWQFEEDQNALVKVLICTNLLLVVLKLINGVATGDVVGGLHSNYMGFVASMSIGIALLFGMFGVSSRWLLRQLLFVALVSLLVSLSRGALVSVLFAGMSFVLIRSVVFSRLIVFLFFCSVVLILIMISVGFSGWIGSDEALFLREFVLNITGKELDTGRAKFWDAAIYEIKNSLAYGIGIEARQTYERELNDGRVITLSVHNFYLAVLLEAGIIGLVVVLFLLSAVLYQLTMFKNAVSAVGVSIFLAIMVQQTTEVSITTGTFTAGSLMWFVWGGGVKLAREYQKFGGSFAITQKGVRSF